MAVVTTFTDGTKMIFKDTQQAMSTIYSQVLRLGQVTAFEDAEDSLNCILCRNKNNNNICQLCPCYHINKNIID